MGKLMVLEKRYTSFFNEIAHYVLLPVFPGRREAQCQMQRPSPGTVDRTTAASRAPPPFHQGSRVSSLSWDKIVPCPSL